MSDGPDVLRRLQEQMASLAASVQALQLTLTEDFRRRCLAEDPRYADPRSLNRHEFQAFSQNGEDGILAEIFSRIGTTGRQFVEFGAGDGLQNNTVYLLLGGWEGWWMDADPRRVERIHATHAALIAAGRVQVRQAILDAAGLEAVFAELAIPEEFDLLSIDVDGNDYWLWAACARHRPRVVVIEYNAVFRPGTRWVMQYDARFRWDGTSHFGASLTSLEALGREKGYALVACDLAGVNAFFVRDDLVGDRFLGPHTAAVHYQPPRYHLSVTAGHPRRVGAFETR